MEVRAASIDDAEAIAVVHVRSWQGAYRALIPDAYLDALSVRRRREIWRRIPAEADLPRTGALVLQDGLEQPLGLLAVSGLTLAFLIPYILGGAKSERLTGSATNLAVHMKVPEWSALRRSSGLSQRSLRPGWSAAAGAGGQERCCLSRCSRRRTSSRC